MPLPALPAIRAGLVLLLASICVAALPASNHARAASKVGTAERITNAVTAKARGKSRVLEKDAPVYRKETVNADQNSSGTILFLDQTKLSIGPGASVLLNDYVTGKDKSTAKRFGIKAIEGAFRFVTGSSEKSVYKIETPVSVIGIRGTVFDLYVVTNGPTGAVLQSGALRICGRSGYCTMLTEPCQFARIDANGRARRRARPDMLPFANTPHEKAFPFDTACAGSSSDPFGDVFTGPGGGGDGDGGGGGGDGDGQ